MQGHKSQWVIWAVIAAAFVVVLVAILRPSRPVVRGSDSGDREANAGRVAGGVVPGRTEGLSGSPESGPGSPTGVGGPVSGGSGPAKSTSGAAGKAGATPAPGTTLPGGVSGTKATTGSLSSIADGSGKTGTLGQRGPGTASDSSEGAAAGSKSGSTGKSTSGEAASGSTTAGETGAEVTPTPAPGEALVGGSVLRGDTPVPGASLLLQGEPGNFSAMTGDQGVYQFVPVAAGRYTLSLQSPKSLVKTSDFKKRHHSAPILSVSFPNPRSSESKRWPPVHRYLGAGTA